LKQRFSRKFREAADQYDEALETYANFAYAQTRLALVLVDLHQYDEGIMHIQKAKKLSKAFTGSSTDLICAYSRALI